MDIFTIGYEGVNIDEFLSMLIQNDIETLVDVRQLPLSRKKGFSKSALSKMLHSSGMHYVHMASLGCPKSVRQQYRADKNWDHYTTGFLEHLENQDAAISELSDMAKKSKCALVCFEADHNFCHRSMVATAVHLYADAAITHLRVSP